MARGINLSAVRARIDRLAAQTSPRADDPWTLEELIVGHRLEDVDPSLTLEDIVAAAWAADPEGIGAR